MGTSISISVLSLFLCFALCIKLGKKLHNLYIWDYIIGLVRHGIKNWMVYVFIESVQSQLAPVEHSPSSPPHLRGVPTIFRGVSRLQHEICACCMHASDECCRSLATRLQVGLLSSTIQLLCCWAGFDKGRAKRRCKSSKS